MPTAEALEAARGIAAMCGKTCDHIINYSRLPCEECVAEALDAFAEERAREAVEAVLRVLASYDETYGDTLAEWVSNDLDLLAVREVGGTLRRVRGEP